MTLAKKIPATKTIFMMAEMTSKTARMRTPVAREKQQQQFLVRHESRDAGALVVVVVVVRITCCGAKGADMGACCPSVCFCMDALEAGGRPKPTVTRADAKGGS